MSQPDRCTWKTSQQKKGNFKSHVAPTVVPKEKQDALRRLAKELNANIELHSVLEHDANGYYKNGAIHLSAKTNNPILNVFKHELTHHIQETAPAEYQKLKDFVMQEYYKGDQKAFRATIDEKVQAYAKQGEKLTRDEAIDEIIANATEKFLTDEAAIEKVVKQDRTLGQAILDAIRKMIESIKGLLEEAKATDRGYSKFIEDLGILEKAERLWGDALKVSVGSKVNINSDVVRYSTKKTEKDKEIGSIKNQMVRNQDVLIKMNPVTEFTADDFYGLPDAKVLDKVTKEFKKIGNSIDRKGFGVISLDDKLVRSAFKYLNTEAEYAAFMAVPKVLKNGVEITHKDNHKGRSYDTYTFAAPVIINGTRGNVAVVVKRTKGYRYKTHRILMPDGSVFVLNNKKTEATIGSMTAANDNREGLPITSASENSISNSSMKNKKQFSFKDSSGRQLLRRSLMKLKK